MRARGESVGPTSTTNPPKLFSRAARVFHGPPGQSFAMSDGARYTVASDGAMVRRNRKSISKKQRNKLKMEARKGSAA